MSVLKKIAFYQNRRDEVPNQELAKELVENENKIGVKEIVDNLFNKEKRVGNCCIKVLYEIGYIKPELIRDYVNEFLKLLKSKVNRQIWGGMIALSTIAEIEPDEIYKNLDLIENTMKKGTKITYESGFMTLCNLASVKKYNKKLFPKILKYFKNTEIKRVVAHAEFILKAVNNENKDDFLKILLEKKTQLDKPSQVKKLDKIINKI